jgi:TRAP transporter TAXI family solute receptor
MNFSKINALSLFLIYSLSAAAQSEQITIATGHLTGVYYPVGKKLCQLLVKEAQKYNQPVSCDVEKTPGSVHNMQNLNAHHVSLAFTQSNWQYHAYNGSRVFAAQGGNKHLRSLFSLHEEPFTIVTRANTNIHEFNDLKNKRINIGEPGSGAQGMLEVLMRIYGMTMNDFASVTRVDMDKQMEALCQNRTDAVLYSIGHPDYNLKMVAKTCDVKLVSLKKNLIKKMITQRPYFSYSIIPGGLYQGNPEPVETVSLRATLVTTDTMSEQTAYLLTKVAYEHIDELKTVHSALSSITPQAMQEGNTAPHHSGAQKYLDSISGVYAM